MLSITGDYEVIYLPGTYGTGSAVTDMKPHNNILTLRGALFTRAGYTQVGWSTVDGGEKVYGFEDVYTKNEALTLYPVWNTNKYTITFDTNGGSEIAPITQDYVQKLPPLTIRQEKVTPLRVGIRKSPKPCLPKTLQSRHGGEIPKSRRAKLS